MVKVQFPGLTLPGFKLTRGQLLNVSLIGVGLVIPPVDITFWPETRILEPFTLFDTDDITGALLAPINAVPKAIWDLAKSKLDDMARDYYERHPEGVG